MKIDKTILFTISQQLDEDLPFGDVMRLEIISTESIERMDFWVKEYHPEGDCVYEFGVSSQGELQAEPSEDEARTVLSNKPDMVLYTGSDFLHEISGAF